jgi:hypothetical protein
LNKGTGVNNLELHGLNTETEKSARQDKMKWMYDLTAQMERATTERETKQLQNTQVPIICLQYLFPCINVDNIFEDKIHEKSLHFQRPYPRTMNFSTQNDLNSFPYMYEAILWGSICKNYLHL